MTQSRRFFITGSAVASLFLGTSRLALAMGTPPRVALITPSAVAEVGWSHELARGAQAIVDANPGAMLTIMDGVAEGPDADRMMQKAVVDGHDFIILGSFGYQNGGVQLARRNPGVAVLHASGFQVLKNFAPFTAKNYEGTYLMGVAAASVSKSGKFGVVAAFAIPELILSINAFARGAQTVRPDVQVSVVWVNSWFDPAAERDAAMALVAQGCDVLFSNAQDTPSVVATAESAGVYVFNLNSSMKASAPTHYLGIVGTDWAPFFTQQAAAHLAGSFRGANHWLGIADGLIRVAEIHPDVPADVRTRMTEAETAIAAGKLTPFDGPVVRADGTEVVPAGQSLPMEQVMQMDWHVQGVTTPLPR